MSMKPFKGVGKDLKMGVISKGPSNKPLYNHLLLGIQTAQA